MPLPGTARPRRYEPIVRHFERAMLAGEFAPGDRLPSERELMASFRVGRGSVREALFALQRMGLVALAAGERAHVTRPSAKRLVSELSGAARQLLAAPEGVRHFQQARRMFECGIAREAALHATDEDLRRLSAAVEANRDARDLPTAIATDVAFHYGLAEVTRNPVLTALHAAMGEWLREQRQTSVQATGARDAANRAHRRIYDAIARRDPDAAAAAMQQHLDEVESYYWQASIPAAAPTVPQQRRRRPSRKAQRA